MAADKKTISILGVVGVFTFFSIIRADYALWE